MLYNKDCYNAIGEIYVKKLGKIFICICLMCSFAFTGCSLVQRNTERYLNRTVATAGEITITKQELINAYNSYANMYGTMTKKLVESAINECITRKILLEKAKDMVRQEADGTTAYYEGETKIDTIFNKNVWNNACWNETFKSINEQIKKLEEKLGAKDNAEADADTDTDNTDTDTDEGAETNEEKETTKDYEKPYEEYEKKVVYDSVTGTFSLVHDELEEGTDDKLTIADFVQDQTGDAEISAKAFKLYVKQLELNYKKLHLTVSDIKTVTKAEFDAMYADLDITNSQKIAFVYELERIHGIHEDNKYATILKTVYDQYKQEISNDFNQKIVNYYKQLVEESYEKYMSETEEDAYTAYVKAMQDDSSKVYYHRDFGTNDKGEKKAFIAVSHVLIGLSDEQKDEIKELETQRDGGYITVEEYDAAYQAVLDKTVVYERDEDGKEIKDDDHKYTVQQVYQMINDTLSSLQTLEEKAVAFNDFLYRFGQDPGMINSGHYYSINLDTDVKDQMVKEFADASRALASENISGGNISAPVFNPTHNGFHIIFNAGLITNDLSIDAVRNMDYSDADYLATKKIMLGTNKTVYDFIYDTIYKSNYTNYEKSYINTTKQSLEIVYYTDAYKDLY